MNKTRTCVVITHHCFLDVVESDEQGRPTSDVLLWAGVRLLHGVQQDTVVSEPFDYPDCTAALPRQIASIPLVARHLAEHQTKNWTTDRGFIERSSTDELVWALEPATYQGVTARLRELQSRRVA